MKATHIVPMLLLTGLAGACAGDNRDGATAGAPAWQASALPAGRTFIATGVTRAGQPRPMATGTTIQLRMLDENQLAVQAGCNEGSGTGRLQDGQLAIDEWKITEKGCEPPLHEQDEWVMGFFRSKPAWVLDGTTLRLTGTDLEMTMADAAAAPGRPMMDTRWTVDTVTAGGTASAAPAGGDAWLQFKGDGTVVGNTGCNTFTGKATVQGDKVTFGPVVATKRGCDGAIGALEAAVLKTMDGAVTYKIEGAQLVLQAANGNGLRATGA